ncbi:MAG: glycosyltransferase [Acidobacteriota bacterium]|nr:glycosyltransferase [Acidobacteriota bacterium]
MRTAVIVLGDLGRSPRMQYHAVSLADAGGEVDLIGLEGAPPILAVSANPRIHVHQLVDRSVSTRARGGVGRFVIASMFRAARQALRLWRVLMRVPKPDTILVQNPPAVPTLAVAWLVAKLRGARLVIDWHNLSHSVAAIRLGERHRAVRALARSERRWARRAGAHLAVSQAMAAWLQRKYGVRATVVYDRPPQAFLRPLPADQAALWAKVAPMAGLGVDRIPLVVCPTSWTPDEDFDLLLEALERADRTLTGPLAGGDKPFLSADLSAVAQAKAEAPGAKVAGLSSPSLAVVLTGKGALRESFEARAARRNFKSVAVRTLWLEPNDYPIFVGMADLGLCLHQSSSGLDLPMKLADFRGPGVPAAAFDYSPVLGEVLTAGKEGVTFRDPGDLANLLVAIAKRSATSDSPLARSRTWLAAHPSERWEDHWKATAGTVLMPGFY